MDATVAVLITAISTLFAAITPQIIQLFRSRSDHAHELKRDQRAKQYDLYLSQYKERRDACADLLIAARLNLVRQRAEHAVRIASFQPRAYDYDPAPAPRYGESNPVEDATQAGTLGSEVMLRAMRVLLADKNAGEVVKCYTDLPSMDDIGDPLSNEEAQAWEPSWRDAVNRLQDAVNAYLHTLEDALFSDDRKASGT